MSSLWVVPLIFILIFCFYMATHEDKEIHAVQKLTHGRASKVEFEGHSYVVWQQNATDCILHDPDCKCHNQGDH